jgi:hypothetical protein
VPLPDPPWRTPRRPEVERALAADASRLTALRAVPPGNRVTCAQFRSVELAAGLAEREQRGEHPVNECTKEAAALLTCFETPNGFFVPVAATEGICGYRLWFVPRGAGAPRPLTEAFEEFDIDFTVLFAPDNLDDDEEIEALLIRGWAHPEGEGESREAFAVEASGERRRLPFDDMKDVDRDGRHDAIYSFDDTFNAVGCAAPDELDPWYPYQLTAPALLLHRVGTMKFSLRDDVSRAARAKSCAGVSGSVVARRAGAVDEIETFRRALCRLAAGEDPLPIQRELESACPRAYAMPQDCKKLRPGVCVWRQELLHLSARLQALRPWLSEAP